MYNNFYTLNAQTSFANCMLPQPGFINPYVCHQQIMPLQFIPYNQGQNYFLGQAVVPIQQSPVHYQQMFQNNQTTNRYIPNLNSQTVCNNQILLSKPSSIQSSVSRETQGLIPQVSFQKGQNYVVLQNVESKVIQSDSQLTQLQAVPEKVEMARNITKDKIKEKQTNQLELQDTESQQQQNQNQNQKSESGNFQCVNKGFTQIFRLKNKNKQLLQISNVVKNFVRAFSFFLKNQTKRQFVVRDLHLNEQRIKYIANMVTQLQRRRKCNNLMLKDLLTQSDISPIFVYFLQKHAADWIDESKIRDKEVYKHFLEIYQNMSSESSLSDHLFIRKRCKRYKK